MNTTFGVGNVLATGFRVWFRNIIPFLVITALFYVPLSLWTASVAGVAATPDNVGHTFVVLLETMGLSTLANTMVSAALTYGVVMELQGQRASFGACIGTGIARFFPVLGVAVLATLCIWGAMLLLIIPGIIVGCMLYVSVQVAVLERPGLRGALSRSRELTRGHKAEIFGLLLVLVVLSIGLSVTARVVAGRPSGAAFDPLSLQLIINLVASMIVGSLGAVMASVAYYFLRAEKEGTSAAELAAIFD